MSQTDLFAPVPIIEKYLSDYVRSLTLPRGLVEAIDYALLGGGKRLRPLLTWHSCVACGGTGEASLVAGTAVELIHAFSLVHDDLPAMDDDDLRRGRPTLHRKFDEATAILAGDAMMALAFHILDERAPSPIGAALLGQLASGTTAMIAGQAYDTLGGFQPGLSDAERLLLVHRSKTGALIRSACLMGAYCVQDPLMYLPIAAYGDAIGLMFQIVDDLIDVEQAPDAAGKKTGKDLDAGKLTYPSVLGVEGSRSEIARLREAAHAALQRFGPEARNLRDLCDHLAVRTR